MKRYSKFWWAVVLLSSAVTGGGTFLLLILLTDLEAVTALKISLALVLVGDIALAVIMQAISPTHIKLGPGERWHTNEAPRDRGTVKTPFEDGRGKVTIRGETWHARQEDDSAGPLDVGASVRVVEREGLTLVVAAAEDA
ncbi:MAG: NfeD family protein [Woeseiaceae bacterium]|nr:NfeD family protein [Woeseiaceae bacterium]